MPVFAVHVQPVLLSGVLCSLLSCGPSVGLDGYLLLFLALGDVQNQDVGKQSKNFSQVSVFLCCQSAHFNTSCQFQCKFPSCSLLSAWYSPW